MAGAAGESRGGRRELDRAKCLRRRNTRSADRDHQGTPKTLEVEVTFVSERPLVFEGSLALNGLDFGVGGAPPSRWNPMSIETEIQVRFRVELQGAQHEPQFKRE